MPKRSGSQRPHSDPITAAHNVVAKLTGTEKVAPAKNPAAQALGRLGGLKGGKARARNLTPEALAEIGRKGAEARWRKKQDNPE